MNITVQYYIMGIGNEPIIGYSIGKIVVENRIMKTGIEIGVWDINIARRAVEVHPGLWSIIWKAISNPVQSVYKMGIGLPRMACKMGLDCWLWLGDGLDWGLFRSSYAIRNPICECRTATTHYHSPSQKRSKWS